MIGKINTEEAKAQGIILPQKESETVNVVKDYRWALNSIDPTEIPHMRLREYALTEGLLAAKITYYMRLIKEESASIGSGLTDSAEAQNGFVSYLDNGLFGGFKDSETYEEKYKNRVYGRKTGWNYVFPCLDPSIVNRVNAYGDEDGGEDSFKKLAASFGLGSLAGSSGGFGRAAAGLAATVTLGINAAAAVGSISNPGRNILDTRKGLDHTLNWSDTTNETKTIQFFLFNTYSVDDILKNRAFIATFLNNNTPHRRNKLIVNPPVFYDLYVKDVIHFPACYVTDFTVEEVGKTLMIDMGGSKKRIPEAYNITITFVSSFMPSRDLVKNAFLKDEGDVGSIINTTEANVSNALQRLQDTENANRVVDNTQQDVNNILDNFTGF